MKKTVKTILLLLISVITYGQEITVKTDKPEYKIDEIIYLEYEIKAQVDSVDILSEANFKIIHAPGTSTSTSTINDKTTYRYTLKYELKALYPGTIEIISPTFYFENHRKKAEKIILKITGDRLTEKEIDEIEFNTFKEKSIYPNGTLRFIVSGKFGYIEEFNNFQWIFIRRLTPKEIAKLKKK